MSWMRRVGIALAVSLLGIDLLPGIRPLLQLPMVITVAVGQRAAVPIGLPGMVSVRVPPSGIKLLNGTAGGWSVLPKGFLDLEAQRPGSFEVDLRIFGLLPWGALTVDAVEVPEVIPGGQSIGLILHSACVLVVGSAAGLLPWIGRDSLRPGDCIVSADGQTVQSAHALRLAVQNAGQTGEALVLGIVRGTAHQQISVRPERSGGIYRIGVPVQTSASGIGTLTFYQPGGVYAALGHPVVFGSGITLPLASGHMVPSLIAGIEKSEPGDPGQKLGILESRYSLGSVLANTPLGVFGRLDGSLPTTRWDTPVAIALEDQVHQGPATMLTVVRGTSVEAYPVDITAVYPERSMSAEGLTIQVTDPLLLRATGGIVQGMSGSPIVQDGRLVGAVTHVFVRDPSRGYGVLAIWMAEQAGLVAPATIAALARVS